ncbi:MAG: AAA family ATPase, partial [Deltaproteobacteria bacterium]|nr:AAA family ATPase [Deltaproteobacteria bacterium]
MTPVDALSSYLPRRLVERLAAVPGRPPALGQDEFHAVAFLADLTGFTSLAADLARDGAAGAEKLTAILDRSLGGLVDHVFEAGGDVIAFAGDSVIAVWPAESEEDLRACAYRTVECARRAQSDLANWEAHPGHVLRLRIGVGVGLCTLVSLGDDHERWGWVAAGPAMLEVGHAERSAEPGTTVLSPSAAALLGDAVRGDLTPSGSLVFDALVDEELPPLAPRPTTPADHALEQSIRAYVPAAVLSRVDSGHTDWLAELRQVTAIFVNFPNLDLAEEASRLKAVALIGRMKKTLDLLGGSLHKVLVDDKGTTVVLAFGLPPLSHEDNEVRAVRAALRIERTLVKAHLEYGIGVSTGRAFCGAYGNDRRREYTMLGDSVNLAARLMQLASQAVWCDADTTRAGVSRIRFDDLGAKVVKGKPEPVRVHQPLGALDSTGRHEVLLTGRTEVLATGRADVFSGAFDALSSTSFGSVTDTDGMDPPSEPSSFPVVTSQRLVGREAQEQVLRERLDRVRQGERGLVLIEGEAGMGKSLLIATLQQAARLAGVPVLVGSADPVRSLEPYHAWREILGPLLGLEEGSEQEDIANWFPSASHLTEWAPLLGPVLGLALEETDSTRTMNGPQRADATRDLLIAALTRSTEDQPLLVVLDDCHWLDAASWQLALGAARAVPDLLLVLSHRPMKKDPPRSFRAILALDGARRVRLDALPDASVADLAARFLGVLDLSPELQKLVVSRAAGNPFFCEEMVYALVESEVLLTDGGLARFAPGKDASSVDLPGTLQGVVTSRLDRLPP